MHLVVFRNRKRPDMDPAAYEADAIRMEEVARARPGFISFKSYVSDDGEVIALSEWESEEAARAWGRDPDHAAVQGRGDRNIMRNTRCSRVRSRASITLRETNVEHRLPQSRTICFPRRQKGVVRLTDALRCAVVTLSIFRDDLEPQEITDLLGGNPKFAVRKGEEFTIQTGKQITARTGMWQFGGEWENAPSIGSHIATLFGQLTQDMDIWKSVTCGADCYVNVGGYFNDWTGGITLKPHVLMLIAERGLAIDFDLYAPAACDAEEMP